MRSHLPGLILATTAILATAPIVAVPAAAQQTSREQQLNRRVERLEQELRAVQRRVFPGGNVEPEISSVVPDSAQPGLPATSPVADLNARVDALERQLASLTGQAEANENRIRQAEESLRGLREATNARLDALERAGAPGTGGSADSPQPVRSGPILTTNVPSAGTNVVATTPPAPSPSAAASSPTGQGVDAAEEAYNAGFRLWEQKRYVEAQQALNAMARAYPRHRLASWARNLEGRAYLDEGKPATAARIFLANYSDNPRGERAADSLFFLGQSLARLNKAADACKAYDELQDVYGQTMRDYIKQRLPAARSQSRCQ